MSENNIENNIYELLTTAQDTSEKFYTLQRQVDNILSSYDDVFDAFSELIQNSFDAVLRQCLEAEASTEYAPKISVEIDCVHNQVTVIDNGCGVPEQHFNKVFRPNTSLKKELRHREARGEKGAAVTFLQFGHDLFEFHTKRDGFSRQYQLVKGREWFEGFSQVIEQSEGTIDLSNLPDADFSLENEVSPNLDGLERGSAAVVMFGPRSNLRSLGALSGNDLDKAFRRWQYVIRTRTAIGYVNTTPDSEKFDEIMKKLEVTLKVQLDGTTSKQERVPVGFLFPHELARGAGFKTSLMTNPSNNSTLLYEYLTPDFFSSHMLDFLANQEYREISTRYDVRGYVSYANRNQLYEELVRKYCGIEENETSLLDTFLQTNGGFAIAVREYPNGKIRTFLHRSGAEDKSRTYVMLDFRGDYKPDYGRKNIKSDVRGFVNELCKQLISFATKRERKEKLASDSTTTPHGAQDLRTATRELAANVTAARLRGIYLDASTTPVNFLREPRLENEVVFIFFELVRRGLLPGYQFYQLNDDTLMLDSLFNFIAPHEQLFIHDPQNNPLGITYTNFESVEIANQWLEFKFASEMLVDDFKKQTGSAGKKWFTTINLLVCHTVDDATDDFTIEPISTENVSEREFFGVTHLLKSATDQSHTIQVISLKTLRDTYNLWR